MQWKKLGKVLKNKKAEFVLWLLAHLGGILISYFACLTIWLFHKRLSSYMPGYEVFLITGTIALAVTGVSYLRLKMDKQRETTELSPLLAMSWPFLLMIVYGVLISIGMEKPIIDVFYIWLISILIFLCLIIWSSIIWLNEQGFMIDQGEEGAKPEKDPRLANSAATLPKIEGE